MTNTITTAVFPVAGLGTRFLPVTKAGPKEMLPIVDKPLIQYVVEEAIEAGITKLVFVTSYSKRAIEDYFDTNYELEHRLAEKGKAETLQMVRDIIPKHISIVYVRQHEPLGLGHAVLCAKQCVGNQPFAVLLADDIIDSPARGCLSGMVEIQEKTGASVLAVEDVPQSETDKYGIVSLAQNPTVEHQIEDIVEKPAPKDAPSHLAVIGRYILSPDIFPLLEQTQKGVGGEIQLTDAIAKLIEKASVVAYPFQGVRYDCGSKLGFLEATIAYALQRPDLNTAFKDFLKVKLNEIE